MRPALHWSLTTVLDTSAPKYRLARRIRSNQLEPDIERIHGAGRKEMSDATGAHDNVDSNRRSRLELRARTVEWGGQFAHIPYKHIARLLGLLADGECGGQLRPIRSSPHIGLSGKGVDRRRREDVYRDKSVGQEGLGFFELLLIFVHVRHGRIRGREPVRVDHA